MAVSCVVLTDEPIAFDAIHGACGLKDQPLDAVFACWSRRFAHTADLNTGPHGTARCAERLRDVGLPPTLFDIGAGGSADGVRRMADNLYGTDLPVDRDAAATNAGNPRSTDRSARDLDTFG